MRDTRLHAPLLLAFESTNVEWFKTRQHPSRADTFEAGLETVLALRLTWEPVVPAAVLQLALDTGLSGYDASYLWVAMRLKVPILSFGRRLARVATEIGVA